MNPLQIGRVALLAALLWTAGPSATSAAGDGPGGVRQGPRAVAIAIAAGQSLLRASQRADGSWPLPRGAAYDAAASALCALAIADDPASADHVERTLNQLRRGGVRDTYAVALRTLLLRQLLLMTERSPQTRSSDLALALRADERLLVEYQSIPKAGGDGLWGYPSPPRNILTTAFALWALADRAGPDAPSVDWQSVALGVMRLQQTSGEATASAVGFGYELESPAQRSATNGWRTAAGLFVLRLSLLHLPAAAYDLRARVVRSERRGATWLAQVFNPNLHPQGQGGAAYYGYLIFLDLWREITRDDAWAHPRWREDCVRVVLQRQSRRGGWEGDDPVSTALAVLFLKGAPSLLRGTTSADPDKTPLTSPR